MGLELRFSFAVHCILCSPHNKALYDASCISAILCKHLDLG